MKSHNLKTITRPGFDLAGVKTLILIKPDASEDIPWNRLLHLEELKMLEYPIERVPWKSLTSLRKLHLALYDTIHMSKIPRLYATHLEVSHSNVFFSGMEPSGASKTIHHVERMIITVTGNVHVKNPESYPQLRELHIKCSTHEGWWDFTQLRQLTIQSGLLLKGIFWATVMGSNLTLLDPPFIYPGAQAPGFGTQQYFLKRVARTRKETQYKIFRPAKRSLVPDRHIYEADHNMTSLVVGLTDRVSSLRDFYEKGWYIPFESALKRLFEPIPEWPAGRLLSQKKIVNYIFKMLSDPRIHPIYFATNLELAYLLNLHLLNPSEFLLKIAGFPASKSSSCQSLRELMMEEVTHPLHVWYALITGFRAGGEHLRDPKTSHPCVMRNMLLSFAVLKWSIPFELRMLLWNTLCASRGLATLR